MRAFLLAVVVAFAISGIASVVLNGVQKGTDAVYQTTSVRIDLSKDGIEARQSPTKH